MNTKLNKNKNKNKLKKQKSEILCETTEECFICLENCHNNEISIKLNENPYYSKICDCNGWVHNYCLNKWYATSSYICPICRKYIFTDLYQYHYPINEVPLNEVPLNEENEVPGNQNQRTIHNNSQITHFVIIISKMKKKEFLLLIMLSFISSFYLYVKEKQNSRSY